MRHKSSKKERRKIAVFDIDGTIFRSSLLIEFNKGLVKSGVVPASMIDELRDEYYAWVERRGSYEAYIKKVVKVHIAHIKGKHKREVAAAIDRAFVYHRDRVYRYTRDLTKRLKRTHQLLAISGSPVEMVRPFANHFGFDHAWGSVFAIDSKGTYTGEVIDRRSVDQKKEILEAFVADHGYTLSGSWGVGDTETDIDFLSVVTNPIAFNPNQKLYTVAKRRGWNIVVERKDVIYKIKN